jgi:hypothetical protein
MTTQLKLRRGTTSQHSTFTGAEGEVTVDTTKDTLVVHDGVTAGGSPMLREDLANNSTIITEGNTKTLTNKTVSLASNTLTGTLAQFNAACSDNDFIGTTGAQTISGKTYVDPIIQGTIIEDVFTITDSAAVDIDPANGSIQLWTLGANRTPTAANFVNGEGVTLMILDGTAFTITWSTINVIWVGGTAPTLDTTKYTVIELWRVGSQMYGALVGAA